MSDGRRTKKMAETIFQPHGGKRSFDTWCSIHRMASYWAGDWRSYRVPSCISHIPRVNIRFRLCEYKVEAGLLNLVQTPWEQGSSYRTIPPWFQDTC